MNENRSIAALVEYILKHRPAAQTEIVGADDELIQRFEQTALRLTGFSLPAEYLGFLQTMGGKTPITFTYDAATKLNEVLETYQFRIADGERLPEECLIIAVGGYHLEQVALQCSIDQSGNTVGGAVFAASDEELKYRMADNLPNLLFRRAFEHFGAAHLPVAATYTSASKQNALPAIAEMFEQFGWRKEWFSDSVTLGLTAPDNDFVIYTEQPPNQANWLKITGKDKHQIAKIGEQVSQRAGLQLEKWWN